MTTRLLPPEEWGKLAGRDIAALFPLVAADDLQVVVVEDGDRIVACWAAVRIVHFEGVWIDPAYRHRPSVIKRLVRETFTAARRWADKWAMTAAADEDVRRLITKHLGGVAVPSDQYIVPLSGEHVCQFSR